MCPFLSPFSPRGSQGDTVLGPSQRGHDGHIPAETLPPTNPLHPRLSGRLARGEQTSPGQTVPLLCPNVLGLRRNLPARSPPRLPLEGPPPGRPQQPSGHRARWGVWGSAGAPGALRCTQTSPAKVFPPPSPAGSPDLERHLTTVGRVRRHGVRYRGCSERPVLNPTPPPPPRPFSGASAVAFEGWAGTLCRCPGADTPPQAASAAPTPASAHALSLTKLARRHDRVHSLVHSTLPCLLPEGNTEPVAWVGGSGPEALGSDPVLTTCSPSVPQALACKVGRHKPGV